MQQFIPYRMYNKIRNLGDAINPYIIEEVAGLPSVYSKKSRPHILGIGSIFFDASEHSYIWGSGLINPEKRIPDIDPGKIRALRGKKTAEALVKLGYRVPDVPFGDPGILVNRLYSPSGDVRKRFRACIVPHHASINHRAYKAYGDMDDVCLFDIMTDDLSSLEVMLESEVVISQSLHGLIFAEALGIPSVWISERFDDNWKFKFQDWYSTTGVPQEEPLALDTPLSELIERSRMAESKIVARELMAALPYREVLVESEEAVMSHRESKAKAPLRTELSMNIDGIRKVSSLDDDDRRALEGEIKGAFGRANAGLAHPVYTFIGDAEIPDATLHDIMRVMDQKHGFVFASIVKGKTPPLLCKSHALGGMKVTKNQHVAGNVMLRPNGRVDFSKDFLTFFV